MSLIFEMFRYTFMVRALTVGLLVTLCASVLGVSMVLKRYSMIGDGLSHVGFAALAVASACNFAPLWVAVPVCIAAAFFLLRLNDRGKIKGDSAIAVVCSGSLAVGVMVLSLTSGMNTDINNYMFGSILSLSREDTVLAAVLSGVVLILFGLLYHRIFAITFDEDFSRATGVKAGLIRMVLAALTAVVVVIGMRLMGALLISSLIIFPCLTAMRICKSYRSVIVCSVADAVVCFFSGITVSFVFSTPTGASIVCVDLAVFAAVSLISFLKKR